MSVWLDFPERPLPLAPRVGSSDTQGAGCDNCLAGDNARFSPLVAVAFAQRRPSCGILLQGEGRLGGFRLPTLVLTPHHIELGYAL